MNEIDIIIFAGQSNMQGETEGLPEINLPIEGALEYRFLSDSLIALRHPIGEDINTDALWGAKNGCGTLVPDFCAAYIKNTEKKVIAVHTARGATTISEWLKGTERYNCLIEKVDSAFRKTKEIGKIGKIFFVWLQGESDAIAGTSKESYKKMLTAFKNDLMEDLNIDKFCVIEVGYFCRVVPWLEFFENCEGKSRDEEIMFAQKEICHEDNDFIMLTEICEKISMDSDYMNPYVGGHYNNKGMTVIGQTAGKSLADYVKGKY